MVEFTLKTLEGLHGGDRPQVLDFKNVRQLMDDDLGRPSNRKVHPGWRFDRTSRRKKWPTLAFSALTTSIE
jgi:hypothetical protein